MVDVNSSPFPPDEGDSGPPAVWGVDQPVAVVDDRERAEQARRAIDGVDQMPSWVVRFGLLSDENRLKILLALHRSPGIKVGDLAAAVGMSDNATSQALSALRIAGVVATVRDGRFRRWTLTDQEIHHILHSLGANHSKI